MEEIKQEEQAYDNSTVEIQTDDKEKDKLEKNDTVDLVQGDKEREESEKEDDSKELELRAEDLDKRTKELESLANELENKAKDLEEKAKALDFKDSDISKRNSELQRSELQKELNVFFEAENIGIAMTDTLLSLNLEKEKSLDMAKILADSFKTQLEARLSEVMASKPLENSSGLVDEKISIASEFLKNL